MQNIYHVSFTVFFFFLQIGLNSLKLLWLEQHRSTSYSIKTNFWTPLTLKMSQNTGAYEPVMLGLAN